MNIPGLGPVTRNDEYLWYYSEPIPLPVLGGKLCRIIVEGYDEDTNRDEYHTAIKNFLSLTPSALKEAEPFVFQYYQSSLENWDYEDEQGVPIDPPEDLVRDSDDLAIESPTDVWRFVRLGSEPLVTRRAYGDQGIYVSLECSCDWEIEHGLQIVFKNGLKVNKVGPNDGHLTNSDAYANDNLEDVVYF